MKIKPILSSIVGFLLILPLIHATASEANQAGAQLLSNQAFITDALNNGPEFKLSLAQYLQTKYSSLSTRSIQEWTLNAKTSFDKYENLRASSFTAQDSNNFNYTLGLEKLFLATGTRLSLEHTNSLTSDISNDGVEKLNTSSPNITLALTQPLLKNAFGLADRFPIKEAELQHKSAYQDVLEAWENRIASLEKSYLAWLSDFETVQAYRDIVDELKRLEAQVKRKYKSGIANEKDMVKTEETLLKNQRQLIQAQSDYFQKRMTIRTQQQGKTFLNEHDLHIKPDQNLLVRPAINLFAKEKIDDLRLVKKLELLLEQQELKQIIADRESLPSLDLFGEYSLKGEVKNLTGGYESIGENKDFKVGLEASLPLGNTLAKASQGENQAARDEIQASVLSTKKSLNLLVNQLETQMTMIKKTLLLQEQLVLKSKRKLELERKDYQIGRLDIADLILAQNNLTTAQLDIINYKIQLRIITIDYLSVTDQLLGAYPEVLNKIKPEL